MQTAFRITLRSAHLSSRNLSSVASESLSTVHRGTAFEELSLRLLHEHLSMSLRRVGGKNDGGIDLQGWWWLPSSGPSSMSPTRIRILAQCKAEKRKYGPKYVREMEGVLHRYLNVDSDPVVGLLISSSLFTKAALLRAHSSSAPLILLAASTRSLLPVCLDVNSAQSYFPISSFFPRPSHDERQNPQRQPRLRPCIRPW